MDIENINLIILYQHLFQWSENAGVFGFCRCFVEMNLCSAVRLVLWHIPLMIKFWLLICSVFPFVLRIPRCGPLVVENARNCETFCRSHQRAPALRSNSCPAWPRWACTQTRILSACFSCFGPRSLRTRFCRRTFLDS